MSDSDQKARSLLDRFSHEINWAVDQVATAFDLHGADVDDLRQEADILIVTYGGLMDGWHKGKLANWESITNRNPDEVKKLLSTALRMDLSQIIGRKIEKEQPTVYLEDLPPNEEPSYTFEDAVIDRIDGERSIRQLYPYLCRHILDGYSEIDMAREDGVTTRTIRRHIHEERERFIKDHASQARMALAS